MSATTTFQERLAMGQAKEEVLVDLLRLSNVPAVQNNKVNFKDVDIHLTKDDIYMDCKYLKTPYANSQVAYGLQPQDCMIINISHVQAYQQIEEDTGKDVWVAFIVEYEQYGIYQLRFYPNKYFVEGMQQHSNRTWGNKFNFSRREGKDMLSFLAYLAKRRQLLGI